MNDPSTRQRLIMLLEDLRSKRVISKRMADAEPVSSHWATAFYQQESAFQYVIAELEAILGNQADTDSDDTLDEDD